jgi:anti-sigma-K factor RskA
MSHEVAVEFLGAYALDAVDGEEFAELEEHLESCPRCRAELDGLREVAAAMGNSVEPLPEGLWTNIASRLPERQPQDEPPAMPQLVAEGRSSLRAHAGGRGRRRRSALTTIGAVAVAVAAAAVAVVLGISLVRADNKVSDLQASAARSASAVTAALHAPGHRVVNLDTSTNAEVARVVVVPSGQGYLVSSNLPALAHDRTYQLWAIEGGQPISLGLLGNAPRRAAFTMAGSARPSHLSITAEPAGGSVSPTTPIVATGSL